MAARGKHKGSNRHYFVLEEGELSDIEDDDQNEKVAEQQRKDSFIREWCERKEKEVKTAGDSDAEMEITSEDETGKIDTKPVAMTVTFLDDAHAKSFKGIFETQMIMRFGPDCIDSNSNCIFVLHETKSNDLTNSVKTPLGVMTIVFHDEKFAEDNCLFMKHFCEELFGVSKVTCCEKWLIEVVQEDLLDFKIDTEPFGYDDDLVYCKNTKGNERGNNVSNGRNNTCFNCLGPHSLRDCRMPRNYRAINENKAKFLSAKAKGSMRYHTEIEKYSDFVPGQISESLRKALGLKSNEFPLHVYKMRQYGYPPGWLLEAKVAHSGVSIYGKYGIVYEEGEEAGEIIDEAKDLFDIRKLISFPGFNTPLPEGVVDECKKYDCPEMSEDQSLTKMVSKLTPNAVQAYKKRSFKAEANTSDDDDEDDSFKSPSGPVSRGSNTDSPSTSQSKPKTPEHLKPASIDLGTPVLASYSPFSKLPDRDKFATDVCDVINFENLPDSTGTYEKMVDSIAKIRKYNSASNFS